MFGSKMFKVVVLGAVLAAGLVLTMSGAQPLADKRKPIVEQKKWAAEELSIMAKSMTMEYAVSSITSAVRETEAANLPLDEIKAAIDTKSAADIRTALLTAAGTKGGKRDTKDNKNIAAFAKTTDPAAMCSTEDTAGGHGFDICVAGCNKESPYLRWQSRKGACLMLCSLATSPCTTNPFWWKATVTAKSWWSSALEWFAVASLRTQTVVLVLVFLPSKAFISLVSDKWGARVHKTEGKQWRCTQDEDKEKGEYLVQTHDRLLKKRALCKLHDFAAQATYQASKEAAAAKAAKAKALRVQAAIDAFVAEQASRDKGDSACVVS